MERLTVKHRKFRPHRRLLTAGLFCAACAVLLGLSACLGAASADQGASPAPTPCEESLPPAQTAAPSPTPSPSPTATPSPTPTPLEELPWNLRLVNPLHPLPQDFTVELEEVPGGQLDARAAQALRDMLADMEAQGLSPWVCSSFRTWEDQERLHANKVQRLLNAGWDPATVEEEASRWVVPAGTSEHQLGLAVDIVSTAYQMLTEAQEDTPEQQWLMAHCQEYGFILRYPADKTDLTGVGYEPWHYRYVGQEAAREITQQGVCLEEYLGAV